MKKWFKKQYRTDADSKLDEIYPNRLETPPIDNDNEKVALSTDHSHMSTPLPGGDRPLKGGYWFIREMYKAEVDAAIAKDKKSWMTTTRIRSSPGAPSRSPIILQAPRQETVPVVRNSGQSSQQPGLPDSPRPPGRLLDPLDTLDKPRPTFPHAPPSRTWSYPPT